MTARIGEYIAKLVNAFIVQYYSSMCISLDRIVDAVT